MTIFIVFQVMSSINRARLFSTHRMNSIPAAEKEGKFLYGSPDSVEVAIGKAESGRKQKFKDRLAEKNKSTANKSVIRQGQKKSKMPFVNLDTFAEYKSVAELYNVFAEGSEYSAENLETTLSVVCDDKLGRSEVEILCDTLQRRFKMNLKIQ